MKYVPSLPPVVTGVKSRLDVYPLTRVKPVKRVQARTLVPLVVLPHGEIPSLDGVEEHPERRHDVHMHGERRIYCRRIKHFSVLIELRSGPDRRRHKQRSQDETEHVDEEV